MSYDRRCYELAEVFLDGDEEARMMIGTDTKKKELAQLIQNTIDDFISHEIGQENHRKIGEMVDKSRAGGS